MIAPALIELGPVAARPTDLLRLCTIPVFAWAMWKDVLTRRISSIVWTPLTVLGVGLLVVDLRRKMAVGPYDAEVYLFTTAIGLGLVVSLAVLFNYIGVFGGADARAFMTIAVLFPFYPDVALFGTELPLVRSTLPIFSFTVVVNTVLWGIFYPVVLAVGNALQGTVDRRMALGIRTDVDDVVDTHGKLLDQRGHRSLLDRLHTMVVPRRRGLDLDALRMYLRWRGVSLEELRRRPAHYADPATLPEEPHDPTTGEVRPDGADGPESDGERSSDRLGEGEGAVEGHRHAATADGDGADGDGPDGDAGGRVDGVGDDFEDPWGAAAFLEDIPGDAYGTSADTLRHGLSVVTERDRVWVSPGIPFLVPVFIGIVVSFVLGDTLTLLLELFGVV